MSSVDINSSSIPLGSHTLDIYSIDRVGNTSNTIYMNIIKPKVFNVKDYGAKGDGTTNDISAINRAIQSLVNYATNASFPLLLYFPNGTYRVSNRIVLPSIQVPLIVMGQSIKNTIIKAIVSTSPISLIVTDPTKAYNNNIIIQNLTLDGSITQPSNSSGDLLNLAPWNTPSSITINNVTIKNIKVINGDRAGIKLRRAFNVNIDNVYINNTWTSIVLEAVRGCSITNSTIDLTYGDGIYITHDFDFVFVNADNLGCTDITVTNNTLTRVGDTAIDSSRALPTKPDGSPNTVVNKNITITNNDISNSNENAQAVRNRNGLGIALAQTINGYAINNRLTNLKQGIWLGSYSTSLIAKNNTIHGIKTQAIGINTPTATIENNYIEIGNLPDAQVGMRTGMLITGMDNSNRTLTINGNTIVGGDYGIRWNGGTGYVNIINNILYDQDKIGITDTIDKTSYYSKYSRLDNNTIMDRRSPIVMQYSVYSSSGWYITNLNTNVNYYNVPI